jgi:hypothetical protein
MRNVKYKYLERIIINQLNSVLVYIRTTYQLRGQFQS